MPDPFATFVSRRSSFDPPDRAQELPRVVAGGRWILHAASAKKAVQDAPVGRAPDRRFLRVKVAAADPTEAGLAEHHPPAVLDLLDVPGVVGAALPRDAEEED